MQAMGVVETLNVSKDAGHGGLTGLITMMIDVLGLKLSKEALHRRIVVTVAGATHTDGDVMVGEQLLVVSTGVVTAAV